jgi:type II secretory pathway component GspD/PulD (secretin)
VGLPAHAAGLNDVPWGRKETYVPAGVPLGEGLRAIFDHAKPPQPPPADALPPGRDGNPSTGIWRFDILPSVTDTSETLPRKYEGGVVQVLNNIARDFQLVFDVSPIYRVVTVYRLGEGDATEVVPLQDAEAKEVLAAGAAWRLRSGVNAVHEPAFNAILLHGPKAAVSDAVKTLTKLVEAKTLEQAKSATLVVRRYPLTHASVERSSRNFQGKQVQVPSAAETLRRLLFTAQSGSTKSAVETARLSGGVEAAAPAGSDSIFQRETAGFGSAAIASVGDSGKGIQSPATNQSGGGEEGGQAQSSSRASVAQPITIAGDTRTNSLMVRASCEMHYEVERIVKLIDVEQEMVELEAIIVAAVQGVSHQFGLQMGGRYRVGTTTSDDKGSAALSSGITGVNSSAFSLGGLDAASLLPTSAGAGLIYQGGKTLLEARLAALSKDNLTRTIASPRIVTLDNLSAKINSTRTATIPITVGASQAPGLATVNAGLVLEITPGILRDDLDDQRRELEALRGMDMRWFKSNCGGGPNAQGSAAERQSRLQERHDRLIADLEARSPVEKPKARQQFRLSMVASNASLTGTSPNFEVDENKVTTEVVVPEQATFVFGGLFSEDSTWTEEGIPLLKDIPVLGPIFGQTTKSKEKTEILFFITPRRVKRDDAAQMDIGPRANVDASIREIRASSSAMDGTGSPSLYNDYSRMDPPLVQPSPPAGRTTVRPSSHLEESE